MRTWKYAFYLSLLSAVLFLVVLLLPVNYSIFVWTKSGTDAGILFPVMLLIWALSLVVFAINNVFVDKCYINQNLQMHPLVKYLPSIIVTPVLCSFIWFVYTLMKGVPLA